jgi:hypothetical protein
MDRQDGQAHGEDRPTSWRNSRVDAVDERYPGRLSMDQDADDYDALVLVKGPTSTSA